MNKNLKLSFILLLISNLSVFAQGNDAANDSVLFDFDLTQGKPEKVDAIGGTWENGWKVIANGDKLVFDAGYKIANGYVEITYTMGGEPHQCLCKTNWFGGYEFNTLSHHTNGDIIYVRAGQVKYGFSRMKASGKAFDASELEQSIGSASDWVKDDSTIQRLKLSWKGISVSFDGTIGEFTDSSNYSVYPVDEIRYGFVGGDNTYGMSLIGLRVLSFKMVDENPGAVPTSLKQEKKDPQFFLNPLTKKISLNSNQNFHLELYNLNGTMLKKANFSNQLDINGLIAGIYILRISGQDNSFTKKILIE